MIYNWAQSAPVQHEKETASETQHRSAVRLLDMLVCVWTRKDKLSQFSQ